MVSLWDTIYRCWVFHIDVSLQEGTTNDGYVTLQPFTLAATDVFILWQISDPASWPLFIVSYLKLFICSGHKNSMIHSQFSPCAGQGDVAKDSVRAAKFFHSPRGAGEPCVSNSKVFVCLQVCREHLCDTAGFDWTFMDTNSQHSLQVNDLVKLGFLILMIRTYYYLIGTYFYYLLLGPCGWHGVFNQLRSIFWLVFVSILMALSCIMKSCLVIYDISCVYDIIYDSFTCGQFSPIILQEIIEISG